MSCGLRAKLKGVLPASPSNPGLELERYIAEIQTGGENVEKTGLLNRLAKARPNAAYESAFRRWRESLDQLGALVFEVRTIGRAIVGLSAESTLEASIALHPIYGMPIIPGDSLKGLASHYFLAMTQRSDERDKQVRVLFGDRPAEGKMHDGAASYVSYLDAWFVPPGSPFALDVMTPHHQSYNSTGGKSAPTDFEDPIPVPFVSARGTFLVSVLGPTPQWSEFAKTILLRALAEWGIGGKTSSGYGRMVELEPTAALGVGNWADKPGSQAKPPTTAPASSPEPTLVQNIRGLKHRDVKPQIGQLARQCLELKAGPERTAGLEAVRAKLVETEFWRDKGLREKSWMKELIAALGE